MASSYTCCFNGASAFFPYMIQTVGPYKQTGLAQIGPIHPPPSFSCQQAILRPYRLNNVRKKMRMPHCTCRTMNCTKARTCPIITSSCTKLKNFCFQFFYMSPTSFHGQPFLMMISVTECSNLYNPRHP